MNPLVTAAIQTIVSNMPEDMKRKLDAIIDKLENKYYPDTWKDKGMDIAAALLRVVTKVPDYPDEVTTNAKDKPEST